MRLSRVNIDGIEHKLRNIVLIIGPNNAGKARLLQDLNYELVHSYERSSAEDFIGSANQDTKWPSMVRANYFEYPDSEVQFWLNSHESWKKSGQQDRMNHVMFRSKNHALQWDAGNDGVLYEDEIEMIKNSPSLRDKWLIRLKQSHIQYASIENRFTEAQQIESIEISNNDNPKLFYARESTLRLLNKHLKKLFTKKLIILQYSHTQYRILLIDSKEVGYPRWARSNNLDANIKTVLQHADFVDRHLSCLISGQSHGTRAALSILMMLADPYRKIVFIDEPESHIYPTARKYIASLISEASEKRQFFVVTHDSEFLERLGNSRKDFTVIKVSSDRKVNIVDFDATRRRKASSELKNTKALRAGFNDVAIFVEGINDRYLYDSILNRKHMITDDIEYGVIDCGGNDSISDSVKFSLEIGTKVAIITDFDSILEIKNNEPKINRMIDSLNAPSGLKVEIDSLRLMLRGKPSKRKGIKTPGLSDEQIASIEAILQDLKNAGIFVVPIGELFDWFDAWRTGVSVEYLRNKYFNNSKKYQPLTKFMNEVANYVCRPS